jgi:2'-5' RNA ligase
VSQHPGRAQGTLRCFIALELEQALRQNLEALGRRLAASAGRGARATPAASLHLTLRFLGSIPASQAQRLGEELILAVRDVPAFELVLRGIGAFPSLNRPRIVWAGFEQPAETLSLLKRRVDEVADSYVDPENRPFHPHLTLVRLRHARPISGLRQEAEALAARSLGSMRNRSVTLMRSDLRPSGAVYTPVSHGPLMEPSQ